MANIYVYSGAAGAGTGADWTNAYTTLQAAMAAKAAGDVFYVAHDHAQTAAAAVTATSPGTLATPCKVLCVNRAGSVPPVSADLRTTATITTTGNFALAIAGSAYYYGIIFNAGSGAVAATLTVGGTAGSVNTFKSCSLRRIASLAAGGAGMFIGNATGRVDLIDTTLQLTLTTDLIDVLGTVTIKNASLVSMTSNTRLFRGSVATSTLIVEGSDLSGTAASPILVQSNGSLTAVLKDCKIISTATVATPIQRGASYDFIRCDSGAVNYRHERKTYEGSLTTETTIVRTGGASDGTTPVSWKIITTANSKWQTPFECFPISIWNDTVGSAITLTVQGIWGGGSVPNSDDIWMDVEYLGSSSSPVGSFATTTKADVLAAGAGITAGSGTWGGSTTKFALAVTITPQMKGPITLYVRAAAVSSTFYIDPLVTVT